MDEQTPPDASTTPPGVSSTATTPGPTDPPTVDPPHEVELDRDADAVSNEGNQSVDETAVESSDLDDDGTVDDDTTVDDNTVDDDNAVDNN